MAILRYRLYDIDRIISRTLAYAIVTGLLVGVYAGLVLLATHVLSFRTPVAVAAATLAAAALFSPARRWVQRAVDRRFNRARYDADQTVSAFAARLKDAVDLDSVQADLAQVVSHALEPAHLVSVGQPPRLRQARANFAAVRPAWSGGPGVRFPGPPDQLPIPPRADSSACRQNVTSPPPPVLTRCERNSAATGHRRPGSGLG